jgi:MFS family permease
VGRCRLGRYPAADSALVSTWGTIRRGLARVVAAAAAVFWGFFFFGLIDFVTPFVGGEEFADHYLIETGWGLTYLVLVAVPLLVLVVRPGAAVALLELTLVGAALGAGALLAGSPPHLLPALGVLVTTGVLALLGGVRTAARPWGTAPYLALISLVALLPAAAYAWDMARSTENPEETWGLDHYPAQAGFAVAVVLVALLTAYGVSGRRGRWLPAATAAFSAIWIGVLSMVWPERVASLGTGWGLLAVVWGIALLAAVVVEHRPSPTIGGPAR